MNSSSESLTYSSELSEIFRFFAAAAGFDGSFFGSSINGHASTIGSLSTILILDSAIWTGFYQETISMESVTKESIR